MSPAPPRPTTATNLLTSAGTFYGYLECSLHLEWLFQLEWLLHSRNEHWLNLLSALYNALEPMPCTPWSPKSGPKTKKCKNSKAVISDIFKIDYLETCNPNCAKGTTVPFSFATREAHNRPVSVFVVILGIWDEQACLAPKYYLSFRICLLFKKYIFNYYPKRPRRYWALLPRKPKFPPIVLLELSVSIELVSSSARVTSVKSQKPLRLSQLERPGPIDRTPGSDKNTSLIITWRNHAAIELSSPGSF